MTKHWIIGCTRAAYKSDGLIFAIKTFFNVSIIETVRWLYNHSDLFKTLLKRRARKQGLEHEILLDALFTNNPADAKSSYDSLCKIIEEQIQNDVQ